VRNSFDHLFGAGERHGERLDARLIADGDLETDATDGHQISSP
jgi:hypothetical protein